ncbi:MAG: outer membrane beta-barrel protein [Chitinophagaceae bacterium]
MNNNFNTNDSLDQLLQNEAEKHRMYPSDKVWENIRVELHGKPKWPALFIIFLSIVGALTIATVINYPPQKFLVKTFENNNTLKQTSLVTIAPKQTSEIKQHYPIRKLQINTHQEPSPFIANSYTPTAITNTNLVTVNNESVISETINSDNSITYSKAPTSTNSKVGFEKNNEANLQEIANNTTNNIATNNENPSIANNDTDITETIVLANINTSKDNIVTNSDDAKKYLNQFKSSKTAKNKNSNSRWKWQAYLTPSISYRTLEDDKARLNYTTNQADRLALKSNVNDVVKHKAALGAEFGVAVMYGLTKNFYVKSGLQFNARQYGIDAYRDAGQATFAFVQNNQLNAVSFQAAYTTKQGSDETKLENTMYQFSMPVGFQWDFINGERWGLGAAATVQPTYTFNKNVYVVSTDYKYYADGTPFFRRWNVNTSIELYLTLKSKSDKWFFGPQVRYQQLPTYNDIYPIKEYRVDYGIKFGFLKSLP